LKSSLPFAPACCCCCCAALRGLNVATIPFMHEGLSALPPSNAAGSGCCCCCCWVLLLLLGCSTHEVKRQSSIWRHDCDNRSDQGLC
jgi:hypothetical protein